MGTRRNQVQRLWICMAVAASIFACQPAADGRSPADVGVGSLDIGASDGSDGGESDVRVKPPARPGMKSLFIGHSFFRPIAEGMPFHTKNAGIIGHTQSIVFSAGASGAPKPLWNNENKRKQIQKILDGGDIELFGMTYVPNHPTIEGYDKWIDYALKQNPQTRFFIALPWIDVPGFMTAKSYSSLWIDFHDNEWHEFMDSIRELYPQIDIFCIPYGQSAGELRNLYEAGKLPDVSALVSGKEPAIFADGKGHAAPILKELSQLVWINAIYGVDLDTYAYDPGYVTDLKSIAKSIMNAHEGSNGRVD